MKAAISYELYQHARLTLDFSPYLSFDNFLNALGIVSQAGEGDLNKRQLKILTTICRKDTGAGLDFELLHDHFLCQGDREYSMEDYSEDVLGLKNVDLLISNGDSLRVSYVPISSPVQAFFEAEEYWNFAFPPLLQTGSASMAGGACQSPLGPQTTGPFSPSAGGFLPVSSNQGLASSPFLAAANGFQEQQAVPVGELVSVSPLPQEQPTGAAPSQPERQNKKRKRVSDQSAEQAEALLQSNSCAKILKELASLRKETKKIKAEVIEIKQQVNFISERLQAPGFNQGMGFFSPMNLQQLSSFAQSQSPDELDEEVARLTGSPIAPPSF